MVSNPGYLLNLFSTLKIFKQNLLPLKCLAPLLLWQKGFPAHVEVFLQMILPGQKSHIPFSHPIFPFQRYQMYHQAQTCCRRLIACGFFQEKLASLPIRPGEFQHNSLKLLWHRQWKCPRQGWKPIWHAHQIVWLWKKRRQSEFLCTTSIILKPYIFLGVPKNCTGKNKCSSNSFLRCCLIHVVGILLISNLMSESAMFGFQQWAHRSNYRRFWYQIWYPQKSFYK